MEPSEQLNNNEKPRNSHVLNNQRPPPQSIQINSTDAHQPQNSNNIIPNSNKYEGIPPPNINPALNPQNQIFMNQPPNSNEQLQGQKPVVIYSGQITTNYIYSQINQGMQINIDALNIKILKFLDILGGYSKIKILCKSECCGAPFRSVRSHQVIGINEQGEENLIMTAAQEEMQCLSEGYMLIYRTNGTVIGALGYQRNSVCCENSCTCCSCGVGGCCDGCCSCNSCCDCSNCCSCRDCCCCKLCDCCCKCAECCKCGECCKCKEGCCENCCESGCCCCPEYCCYCPNCKTMLLDLRFLNTVPEAFNMAAGLYVSTLYNPFNCLRCSPEFIGYEKCGEKFAIDNKCFSCSSVDYNIINVKNLENKEVAGNARQTKTCFCDVESFDLDFPKDALPLEKLLIISEVFMLVFLKWDEGRKNRMLITKKWKFNPGLNPDFI